MSLRDDILGLVDLATDTVHVPEWDTDVRIRALDLTQGMVVFGKAAGGKVTLDGDEIAAIVAWAVIDENGKQVFKDSDVEKLAQKNHAAMTLIYQRVMALTGSKAKAKKNSKASQR